MCDFLGEKIASVLGISTPKYQYAIDEYYRMKKEVCFKKNNPFSNVDVAKSFSVNDTINLIASQ